MKDSITATQRNFESSSTKTPAYLEWHRRFKRDFTKFLKAKRAIRIEICSPNHFNISGFFTLGVRMWYFSISDIRWSKDKMLLRTVKSYKDFTGGDNQYASLKGETEFIRDFQSVTCFSQGAFLV